MKTIIAKNDNYELAADSEKNRAYLKIIGFWRNPQEVSDYIEDWKKTLSHLKSGFTLLTDATEMKVHPPEVKEVHAKAQDLIIGFGVKQVAEVLSNVFSTAQLDSVASDTTMPKKNFKSWEEAERFLDSVE